MKAVVMLWSSNLAQWEFLPQWEGLCQSLEEAPGTMGLSATGHTYQSLPL